MGEAMDADQAATCHDTIAHYRAGLAVVGATQPLRVLARQAEPTPSPVDRVLPA